jgi:predicted metal-binding protein
MQFSEASSMKAVDIKSKKCACTGTCTGYATRIDCPPLIVLAVAVATAQAAAPAQ